ncbi:MAG: response regulator [Gaiellaceae bacterium]
MPPAQVRPDEVTPLQGRPRVLVVDDDAGIRLVCATTLTLDGCHAIEAANGQEALELALAEPPDLVLLDLSMPVLDGFGLAAALRADERTRDVPLVILTGESVLHLTKTIDATGALGFFTKPFDPAAISAFIRNVLAGYPNSSRSASVGA